MGRWRAYIILLLTLLLALAGEDGYAQLSNRERKKLRKTPPAASEQPQRYRVEGGVRSEVHFVPDTTETVTDDRTRDSLRFAGAADASDSLAVVRTILRNDSTLFARYLPEDSLFMAEAVTAFDSLSIHDRLRSDYQALLAVLSDSLATVDMQAEMTKRQLQRLARASDTTRHNRFFRDSIPISKMCWYSAVIPGFGQFYNEQYRKIPIVYASLGATLSLGMWQNRLYKGYKSQYDALIYDGARPGDATVRSVQTHMIQHNTWRQMGYLGAVASYIYFIGDGAINYKAETNKIKKATTLSTICPGAGQFYNGSYWRVPIVVGGLATMFYIIDWNNRGYKRFQLAYDMSSAYTAALAAWNQDPNRIEADKPQANDEFRGSQSPEALRNWRNMFRRSRDLAIILTGLVYLFNIVDAHVDAQLKDWEVNDDLSVIIAPTLMNYYTMQHSTRNTLGLSAKFYF